MAGYIFLFIFISALFRGLDQIIRFNQQELSWLPKWVFTWNLGLISGDAEHIYMYLKMTFYGMWFGLVMTMIVPEIEDIYSGLVVIGSFLFMQLIYYQAFNLFFHVLLKKIEYVEYPFFRVTHSTPINIIITILFVLIVGMIASYM